MLTISFNILKQIRYKKKKTFNIMTKEMFCYHPEQCLVGKSSVILDGGEHTEDQADQHWEKPDKDQDHEDNGDDHEEGDPPWNKKGFCGSFVYQDISRENPHFRGNRD